MATLSKNSLSKQAKAIAGDSEALKKTARRAQKSAQQHASEARKHATTWSKQAEKQTRKARAEAEQRREELMEKFAAGAGVAMSVAPIVAKAVMSNKKHRRRAAATAATAGTVVFRLNPIVLGATVAGAGFVGYRMWKRRQDAANNVVEDAFDDDPVPMQHARMDDEGPVPGAYDSSVRHMNSISKN